MNNMTIEISARNDSKVTAVIMTMLATMEFETVKVKRYECIGVNVKVDGIEVDENMYAELLDNLRNLRKLDNLWENYVNVTLTVDVYGNEYQWGYSYDHDYDGNAYYEWGAIEMKELEGDED